MLPAVAIPPITGRPPDDHHENLPSPQPIIAPSRLHHLLASGLVDRLPHDQLRTANGQLAASSRPARSQLSSAGSLPCSCRQILDLRPPPPDAGPFRPPRWPCRNLKRTVHLHARSFIVALCRRIQAALTSPPVHTGTPVGLLTDGGGLGFQSLLQALLVSPRLCAWTLHYLRGEVDLLASLHPPSALGGCRLDPPARPPATMQGA
jgi:hypothetical protein